MKTRRNFCFARINYLFSKSDVSENSKILYGRICINFELYEGNAVLVKVNYMTNLLKKPG